MIRPEGPPLQQHMVGTYHALRLGIGIVGFALPFLLWFGGSLAGVVPQTSMSMYYHTAMRDVFVGVLVAIGLMLLLYKGFSSLENWALNAGGMLAVVVAMLPTARDKAATGTIGTLHIVAAVSFFACIAYVSVFRASDTLSLIRDTGKAKVYRKWYRLLGIGMVASPLLALVISQTLSAGRLVFFVELAGVVMFALYWLVKSSEMRMTEADQLALEGKLLRVAQSKVPDAAPGRIIRQEDPESARREMEETRA
jgi:hypothetical protein